MSKAAKQLFVSQPTLSRCLSELEEELNVVLMSRTTQKLELTQEGHVFLKEARSVLHEYNKLFTLFPREKAPNHSTPIEYCDALDGGAPVKQH